MVPFRRRAGLSAGMIVVAWAVLPGVVQPHPTEAGIERQGDAALVVGPPRFRDGLARQDSTTLHREARDAQARFERERLRRAPYTWRGSGGECTEIVGRICLRFEPEDDEPDPWEIDPAPPGEAPELGEARAELLEVLDRVSVEIPGDAWVAGQRVRYRGEAGDVGGALEAARDCRAPETGWCPALRGLAELRAGDLQAAERQFREALSSLPDDERREWLDPSGLVDVEIWRRLEELDGPERRALVERIWHRSDPWLSTPPNELLLAHLGRHVSARIREGTRTPYGLGWGNDLTRILVRYGAESGYERIREPSMQLGPARVIGHHWPGLRHHLPRAAGVLAGHQNESPVQRPGTIAPAVSFTTERKVARSLHRPEPASRIRDLTVQMARFPRGADSVAFVVAWRAPRPEPEHPYWSAFRADSVPPPYPGDADPELWLQPWESRPAERLGVLPGEGVPVLQARRVEALRFAVPVRTAHEVVPGPSGPDGVTLLHGPDGDHLVSFELVEPDHRRGWRHRRGISGLERGTGGLAVSDLLLLRADPESASAARGAESGADPGTLRDWLRRVRPDLRVPQGPIEIAWELHAEGESLEAIEVSLEVVQGEGGFFRRLGRTLRLLDRPSRARISWTEAWLADEGHPARMSQVLRIDLSDRDHGEHEVVLRVSDGRGRTASTRLTIEIGDGS